MSQTPSADGFKDSVLPATRIRAFAFATIVVGGSFGGVIGYLAVGLQCHGDCSVPTGLGALTGSTLAATGSAVIAVLVLRAMTEWSHRVH